MQIHALRTGIIRCKKNYVNAKGSNRLMRLTSSLMDNDFTEIPVYAWVIEHPEGVIVIDTGENAQTREASYFPLVQRPYWLSQYEFLITPEEEIGPQLRALGIPPNEVRWVVLTHAHFDHTDGINYFPNSEIIISRKEHQEVFTWKSAHFAFPSKWRSDLNWRPIDYVPQAVGSFREGFTLTQAGDVHIVPTPGHTLGHQSVILEHDGFAFFFAGDTSFDLKSFEAGLMDAPAFDANKDLETRRLISAYAEQKPLIYLTTHDPNTERRLQGRIPLWTPATVHQNA